MKPSFFGYQRALDWTLEDAEFRTLHPSSTHHVERRNANWFPFQLKRVILWLVPTIKNYRLESVKISVAQQKGGFTWIYNNLCQSIPCAVPARSAKHQSCLLWRIRHLRGANLTPNVPSRCKRPSGLRPEVTTIAMVGDMEILPEISMKLEHFFRDKWVLPHEAIRKAIFLAQ